MGKYYYLVSGLPNIAFDGLKPPYSIAEFKEELALYITKGDKRLLECLMLRIDNQNLLEQLQHPDYEMVEGSKITLDELNELINGIKAEFESKKEYEAYKIEKEKEKEKDTYERYFNKIPKVKFKPFRNKNKRLPVYFEPFARLYLASVESGEEVIIPWEDRLSAMYYAFAMKSSNTFLASWFELNLNINNIFTALTCRKYKLNRENYIVGNTEVSNKLRTSNARDFELGETLELLLPPVLRIAEEADLSQREWKKDLLKWEWLDEQIFTKVFGIEAILTYWLKLEMLEYWSGLNKSEGEEAFRQMVGAMKKGSSNILEEFKRNNKK